VLSKITKFFGLAFSFILVGYLGYQFHLSDGFEQLQQFSLQQYLLSLVSIFIYLLATFLLAFVWSLFFNQKQNQIVLLNAYIKTILWKYLPTNTLHFIGRHFYLKAITRHTNIILNNILEVLFLLLSALSFIILLLVIDESIMIKNNYISQKLLIFITLFLFVSIAVALFKKNIFGIKRIILINIYYLIFQFLSALSFIFLWFIFIDNNTTINTYLQIMVIYTIGWLLGFIVIGAPAGIGVREGVYLLLLQPLVPSMGLLITFLLLSRIVNVVAEVLLYLLSFLLRKEGYKIERYGE